MKFHTNKIIELGFNKKLSFQILNKIQKILKDKTSCSILLNILIGAALYDQTDW